MTTRITLSILLTTWIILIIGQTAAFLTARQSLLALLDDTLITRATRALDEVTQAEPEAHKSATTRPIGPAIPPGDHYGIRSTSENILLESQGEAGVARDDLDLSVVAIASGPGPARQHSDCVPPPQKSVDQVRAHEASAAGDEDLHFQSPIGAFNITAVVNQSGDRAKTIG